MEPMTLGSPTANPASPPSWNLSQGGGPPLHSLSLSSPPSTQNYSYGVHPVHPTPQQPVQQPTQSGFLPGYLMGDPVMSPSTPLRPGIISPTKLSRTLSSPGSVPNSPLPTSHPLRGPQLLKETLNRSTRTPGDKPGGPPTTGLMNSLNNTPNRSVLNTSSWATPDTSSSVFPATPSSTQVCEGEDAAPMANWVTVWGFPPSAASFVLQQFGSCGTVLQHIMPPNSNWMHIRFQTRLQASKAMSKNSSVLGGSIMVGVMPCKEESVLDNLNSSLTTSVLDSSVTNLSSNLGGTPRSIRPLTQAYRDGQSDTRVVPGTNTPTKSSGVVSKAMGYMFGW